ncbi:MAG: chemotaxis protein CheD [Clostridia bacterium]|nr:chemotaxis protein CheD [Clostridia bacterium]
MANIAEVSIADMIKVGMGDMKVGKSPRQIITLGLGSCVGITMYDRQAKIGGMLHAMLPNSARVVNNSNKAKFVDTGIVELLTALEKEGASLNRLEVKLVGGATMFSNIADTACPTLNIGENNIRASKEWLSKFGLRILAEETGSNFGRTIVLDLDTGLVEIRAIGQTYRYL